MTGISIYVEGGGDTAQQRAELRLGFDALLKEQKKAALARGMQWRLVPCGARSFAYEAFMDAARNAPPGMTQILLVDAEEGLADQRDDGRRRLSHLRRTDGWDLSGVDPERIHLMVQCMEAWILADTETLGRFYGQGFASSALPRHANLEEAPKIVLLDALNRATERTQKGKYGKIRHASKLLGLIDPAKAARRCPHFALFRQRLQEIVNPGTSA